MQQRLHSEAVSEVVNPWTLFSAFSSQSDHPRYCVKRSSDRAVIQALSDLVDEEAVSIAAL
jgi:ribosomal protein L18